VHFVITKNTLNHALCPPTPCPTDTHAHAHAHTARQQSEDLCKLPNLQLLYLHANEIKKLTAVKDMFNIPTLRGLTLHGNELEEVVGYRQFIVTYLPQLMSLDFTRITEKERTDARHIVDRHGVWLTTTGPQFHTSCHSFPW
jgi:hypothetical protein